MKRNYLGNQIVNYIHPINGKDNSLNLPQLVKSFHEELDKCYKAINSKNKNMPDAYIIDWIYCETINSENEYKAYVKCNIYVALNLLNDIKKHSKKGDLESYAQHIEELALDISWAIEYVHRKILMDEEYKFFSGGKSRLDKSFVVFKSVESNFWRATFDKPISKVRDDIQVSVALLRKSIEQKLQYIVGVYDIYDNKYNRMKSKGDFYYNFIANNFDLIKVDHPSLKNIYRIMNWASSELHSTRVPLVHSVYFAINYVRPMFISKEKKDGSWNIDGSVEIKNYHDQLLTRFVNSLPDDRIWCINLIKPDAHLVID